jgi:hypothetical protein
MVNKYFDNEAKFKYLGTRITNKNSMNEEIKNGLNSQNACYHSDLCGRK